MQGNVGRRGFLKAGAAIATAGLPILGANDRINLGIVGLGGRGRDHIDFSAALSPECRIAAICDVNQPARERGAALVRQKTGAAPAEYADLRRLFESKDIDAVTLAIPNHWHALGTIWACQAGKDVYVEKPASHNVFEGEQMIKAARKYNRVVQVGTQSRSIPHYREALRRLQAGVIGQVVHARGLCFRRRFSIGHTPDESVPAGLNWDVFLGPAKEKPFSRNKFAYNWHWFWDTGNGDIGNQGVHEMDIALWGLPRAGWPASVSSSGGKLLWNDDQQTPNTQMSSFDFGDALLAFEVRNLPTPPEGLGGLRGPNYVGNIFFGDKGFMVVDQAGFQIYLSTAAKLTGEAASGIYAGQQERYEKIADERAPESDVEELPHFQNFFDAIRSRDPNRLRAGIEVGARSAAFCHLANASYRVKRALAMDRTRGRFLNAPDADALLGREYRAPYVVPRDL